MAERPAHIKPPTYLSKSPPVPQPDRIGVAQDTNKPVDSEDPTRFGDWTLKGIAVDF